LNASVSREGASVSREGGCHRSVERRAATESKDFHGCQSLAPIVRRKIDKMSDINFLRISRLSYPRLVAHLTMLLAMLRGGRREGAIS
jgi:hypothetical protein